jgi:hypothetical protein
VGRCPSTISRELRRNRTDGEYHAAQAQREAERRRQERPLVRKMDDPEINEAVRAGCSNSLIAADGIVSVPNLSVGCVCNYPMQCAFAMVHMPEAAQWRPGTSSKQLLPPAAYWLPPSANPALRLTASTSRSSTNLTTFFQIWW